MINRNRWNILCISRQKRDASSSFDRSKQGDTFSLRCSGESISGRSRVRACKLLHIFSIIFLEFSVHPRDLPFLSLRQTSRRLVQREDSSLHDSLDTFHPFSIILACRGCNLWHFSTLTKCN